MAKVKWQVGMRVVNTCESSIHCGAKGTVVSVSAGCINIMRDDTRLGAGPDGSWTVSPDSLYWEPIKEAAPPIQVTEDWSYAEADRLYDAAVLAVEAYNNYIERKPTTTYGKAYTPAKYF